MSNQENKETKSNRALMIVFVVLAGILLLIGGSIYPVSYTHLDVYKRQG